MHALLSRCFVSNIKCVLVLRYDWALLLCRCICLFSISIWFNCIAVSIWICFFFFIKLKFLCASLWNNNAFDLLIYAILNVLSFLASFKLSLEFQTNATRTRFVFSTNANSIYITQLLQSFSHSVHRHRRSLVACNTHIVRMENGKVR